MDQAMDVLTLGRRLGPPATVTLLDVRRRADLLSDPRRIPGAEWRDPEKVERWRDDLPRDRPVVVYCVRGGSVSRSVAAALQQHGLEAHFLAGGLAAWLASLIRP